MVRYYLPPGDVDQQAPIAPSYNANAERGHNRRRSARAVLRRRFASILSGFAGVVAFVAVITFLLPARYESTASFLIEGASTSTASGPLAVLDRLGRSRSAETEIALLRSHSVLTPVIDALDLHVTARKEGKEYRPGELLPQFAAALNAQPGRYLIANARGDRVRVQLPSGEALTETVAGSPIAFNGISWRAPGRLEQSMELDVVQLGRTIERLQRKLQVQTADADAEVITVNCQARSAVDAQLLCSALSDSYLRLRSSLQRAEADAAAAFLVDQVKAVGLQLRAAENEVRRYDLASRAIALDTRARGEVERLIDVKAEREGYAAELGALETLMRDIEAGAPEAADYRKLASFPAFMKSQNQVVAQLLESMVQLENRRTELALRRSEQNPDLVAVNQRIAEIQDQLRSMATTYRQGLNAQVASLDLTLARGRADLAVIPEQEIESARLRRQVKLLEELYHFLQTRLHEAEVAQAVNLPSVRIVDRASLPFRASWPNVPLNLGLAIVLGLGFGVMLGLYREYSDTRIYERHEVEHELGIPVVGMVARLEAPGPISLPSSTNGGGRALTRGGSRVHEIELAWEAFHGLALDLRFARNASPENRPRSVAITSTSRGEGKTLAACNLAIAWASYPARTLVIDGDLRAGAVSRFFSMSARSPGLSDVLGGTSTLEDAVRVVEPIPGVKLHVLPAGTYNVRFAELFDTQQLNALIETATTQFDLVIIDTPPLNVLSDAAAVAARVDSVLVVVRGGTTDRAALDVTLRRLARAGGHVEGIVLNDVVLPEHYVRYSKLSV